MSDAALRSDVLRVLQEAGVDIQEMPDNYYRVAYGEELQVVRMLETVSRSTVDRLTRLFHIPKARFFPPLKAVPAVERARIRGAASRQGHNRTATSAWAGRA